MVSCFPARPIAPYLPVLPQGFPEFPDLLGVRKREPPVVRSASFLSRSRRFRICAIPARLPCYQPDQKCLWVLQEELRSPSGST